MTDYLKKLGKELQDIKPSKAGREKALANAMDAFEAVSYTHLTLPTILLV